MTLTEIANKTKTDKGTLHYGHGYTLMYEELFEPLRKEDITLMEIGIYDDRFPGASVRMWQEYFDYVRIIGFDINPKAEELRDFNVDIYIGDQNSPEDLIFAIEGEKPPTIIIDDGSHMQEHMITSFKTLFPYVAYNGYYIIEDLHSVHSNTAETIAELWRIIEEEAFNVKYFNLAFYGKVLIIKKGAL